jgi:hypothetical protein
MKMLLAGLAGFILGAMLFHSSAVKAQGGGGVNVMRARTTNGYNSVLGSRVVGFSCASDGTGNADCYIATQ